MSDYQFVLVMTDQMITHAADLLMGITPEWADEQVEWLQTLHDTMLHLKKMWLNCPFNDSGLPFQSDHMVRVMAHDIQSPLHIVMGYCDLLLFDLAVDSPAVSLLRRIQNCTEEISLAMDDLLASCRS